MLKSASSITTGSTTTASTPPPVMTVLPPVTEQYSGRAFAVSQQSRIQTWSEYTSTDKPLRLDEKFGKKKMALVIPVRAVEGQQALLNGLRSQKYTSNHNGNSVNIRDFCVPRQSSPPRSRPAEPEYINIAKYRETQRSSGAF